MNPSGGIGYHLAALRYAKELWRPFREELSVELSRRFPTPEGTDLVLVGPSGGYCLEPHFLSRFRSVTAIDIDPFVGVLLRVRFGGKIRFIKTDFFRGLEENAWDLSRWLSVIGARSDASFLFSNLLGQLGFLYSDERLAEIDRGLVRAFTASNAWVSFHDRFTVELGIHASAGLSFESRPASEILAEAWSEKWSERRSSTLEMGEHEIGSWIMRATGRFDYFPWRLDSRHTQLIEVCGSAVTS